LPNIEYYGTGRRKTSTARVFLRPGSGTITVNHREFDNFFPTDALRLQVRRPLLVTETGEKFDILATVAGGGVNGQAGAVRLGIARALVEFNNELRKQLKNARSMGWPAHESASSSVNVKRKGGALPGIAIKDLLEAGVHFGHQTKRWNPKMKEFIFGERNGIYILDLNKTVKKFRDAEEFVTNLAADGKTMLFVGTKRQAQDVIAEESQRCGMFFINQRWLGGLLTNFSTIQRSLGRLRDLEAMVTPGTDGRYETLSKKEIARAEKEKRKLLKNLEGIRPMNKLPDAIFVVDTRKEKIAVDEARKLKIPVIGIVDTNCDPDQVDYIIPGNDDALRSVKLFVSRIADAVIAGRGERESAMADQAASEAEEKAAAEASRTVRPADIRKPQRPAETPAPTAQ